MWYSESIIINTDEHHQNVLKRFRHKKLGHSFGRKVSGHNNKVVSLSSPLCACELSLDSWHWNQVYISFWINFVKNRNKSGSCEIYMLWKFIRFWINILSWRHETDLSFDFDMYETNINYNKYREFLYHSHVRIWYFL